MQRPPAEVLAAISGPPSGMSADFAHSLVALIRDAKYRHAQLLAQMEADAEGIPARLALQVEKGLVPGLYPVPPAGSVGTSVIPIPGFGVCLGVWPGVLPNHPLA